MNEKREKNLKNIFKTIFITLFVIFLTLYLSQMTGYNEYEQYEKKILTEEKIKEFEQDVALGKNIDITNYLESINKDYNNKASNLGANLSNKVEVVVKKSVKGLFKFLNKLFEE